MPKVQTTKNRSSRQVHRTRLARATHLEEVHPEARGVRTASTSTLTRKGLLQDRQETDRRIRQQLESLGETSRNALAQDIFQLDYEPETIVLQPREKEEAEWEDIATEGGELGVHHTFIESIRTVGRWMRRGERKGRTWRGQRVREQEAWGNVFDPLVQRYLHWMYHADPDPIEREPQPIIPEAQIQITPDDPPVTEGVTPETLEYSVNTLCLFSRQATVTVTRRPDSLSPALDLMRHGWLAKTPSKPTVAVSLKTLELLYRLRQRKASYSVEAFAKVLCDYYQMPYRRYLRDVLGDTFELYLRIIRKVEKLVHATLGWDGPDWRPKNACRACCYVLNDEPPLRFSRMYAMDGNNSLKRMATIQDRVAADTRVLDDSTYFLSREFVDKYAKEVRGASAKGPAVGKHQVNDPLEAEDEDSTKNPPEEGDPTDGLHPDEDVPQAEGGATEGITTLDKASGDPGLDSELQKKLLAQCVDNWKSAAKDESKRMWSIFDESGIFASACRHGLILWIMDMVKSGELAKYPLATVAKVLECMGNDTLGGYDIGCAFLSTIQRSSLAPAFQESNGSMCVCAFHGYSHCHTCQLQFHPNNIVGAGLEDLETMERVFSASNQLASVTRYASPYRRLLYMEAYFRQWDEDKTLNTGDFILNNYRQAAQVLTDDRARLQEGMASLGITDTDMAVWDQEELQFFAHLGEEDPYDIHAIAYVELLQELRDLASKKEQTSLRFLEYNPRTSSTYKKDVSATQRVESERRHADERFERVSLQVCALEVRMGLTVRWTPSTPQYAAALTHIKERKYRRALDKLQQLVIQRLFELHKLNVSQTGYKMRTHIAKSLQTRCKAIQRAIKAYNEAAAALTPPRPPLDWSRVAGFNFLEEFTLLQDTRNDIRHKLWSTPAVREMMKIRHRLARAQEEIDRLNVEVRRLHTAIHDEASRFDDVLKTLKDNGDPIFGAVDDFVARRKKVNARLMTRINQVYALPDFSGVRGPGTRLGTPPTEPAVEEQRPAPPALDDGPPDAPPDGLPDGLLTMPELPEVPIAAPPKVNAEDSDDSDDDEGGGGEDVLEDEEQQSMDNLVHFITELAS